MNWYKKKKKEKSEDMKVSVQKSAAIVPFFLKIILFATHLSTWKEKLYNTRFTLLTVFSHIDYWLYGI